MFDIYLHGTEALQLRCGVMRGLRKSERTKKGEEARGFRGMFAFSLHAVLPCGEASTGAEDVLRKSGEELKQGNVRRHVMKCNQPQMSMTRG